MIKNTIKVKMIDPSYFNRVAGSINSVVKTKALSLMYQKAIDVRDWARKEVEKLNEPWSKGINTKKAYQALANSLIVIYTDSGVSLIVEDAMHPMSGNSMKQEMKTRAMSVVTTAHKKLADTRREVEDFIKRQVMHEMEKGL